MAGISRKTRSAVIRRDGKNCRYCGRQVGEVLEDVPYKLTMDHVVPSSADGTNRAENLVVACLPCNIEKDDSMPEGRWKIEGFPGETKAQMKEKIRTRTPLTHSVKAAFERAMIPEGHGLESRWLDGCDCPPCTQAHVQANGLRGLRRQPRIHRRH